MRYTSPRLSPGADALELNPQAKGGGREMAKGEDALLKGRAPSGDPSGTTTDRRNGNGIDFVHKGDVIEVMAAAGSSRRQSLDGFLPDYTDIVDYIVRTTHKMWEEGG